MFFSFIIYVLIIMPPSDQNDFFLFSLQPDVEGTTQVPVEAIPEQMEEEIVAVEEKMVIDGVAEATVEGSEFADPTLSGEESEQDEEEDEANKSISKKIWHFLIS